MLRVLFLADIVGESARRHVYDNLQKIKEEEKIDFIIVNGENAAGGRGITGRIAIKLMNAGVSVITTGNHVWDQVTIKDYIDDEPRLLRPINYPKGTIGNGSVVLDTPKGKIAVINAQGRSFISPPLDNPFLIVESEINRIYSQERVKMFFIDFHAETTSEKIAMGRFLDGKVSAVVGTHTHVQTADERIFENGTSYITDAGMCGPKESILGSEIEPIVNKFVTSIHHRFKVAKGDIQLQGVIVDIEETTGKATSITRFNRYYTV